MPMSSSRTAASTRAASYAGRAEAASAVMPLSESSLTARSLRWRLTVRRRPLGGREHGRDVRHRAALAREPDGPLRPPHDIGEDLREPLLAERLALEQRHDEGVEHAAVLDQDLPRLVVRVLDEAADLLVDDARD